MRPLLAASPLRAARRARAVLTGLGAAFLALDVLLLAGVVTVPHRPSGCGVHARAWTPAAQASSRLQPGLVWLRLGDGRARALLTAGAGGLDHPAVAPDGKRIAFLAGSNGIVARLDVCDLGSHRTRTLGLSVPAGDFPLSWDWNGKTLVFLGGDALGWGADQRPFLVEPSGRRLRPLAGDSPWYYDGAVLSPDGSKLALLLQWKYPDGREPEIVALLDLRTTTLTRVAGSSQVAEIDGVSWSPDGRRLVLSAYRGNDRGGLYVVDVATRRLTPLLVRGAGARMPAWSPDGAAIAFVRGGPRASSIWLLDLRTGSTRRLTRGGVDVAPAWAPDGKALVFVRRRLAA